MNQLCFIRWEKTTMNNDNNTETRTQYAYCDDGDEVFTIV